MIKIINRMTYSGNGIIVIKTSLECAIKIISVASTIVE